MTVSPQFDPADLAPAPARLGLAARILSALVWVGCLSWSNLSAAEPAKKSFDIPAGTAPGTLKEFSAQAGGHLLYSAAAVEGVKTNAVKGELTAREVIERMLTGTRLAVKQDEKTGAMAIMGAGTANEQNGRPAAAADAQSPTAKKKTNKP